MAAAVEHDLPALIGDWVDGWSKSRRSGVPVAHDWGYSIEVGTETEVGRFVLTDGTDDTVRRLAASVDTVDFWIKVPRPVAEVAPLLGPGWEVQDAQTLMTTTLATAAAAEPLPVTEPPAVTEPLPVTELVEVPDGYALSVDRDTPASVQVEIAAPDGSVAARGRMGFGARFAVADRVLTASEHQRRGLGRIVMSSLGGAAIASGYDRAILMASIEGRALYSALGWSVVSPFTEARFVGH